MACCGASSSPPTTATQPLNMCAEPVWKCCRSRWTRTTASVTAPFSTLRATSSGSARSGDKCAWPRFFIGLLVCLLVYFSLSSLPRAAGVKAYAASTPHLRDLARLRRVRDRIDREYEQPLDVEALARGAHMSAGHLSREFRLAYSESPYRYLMTRPIERAVALLRRGDLSVTEVCFAVGCSSLGTFSTRFTELVGMPPGAYRSQAAGAMAGIPPCITKQVTRPIRNREARAAGRS